MDSYSLLDIRKYIKWFTDGGYGNPFAESCKNPPKLVVNAALTGMVPTRKDTPYVPLSPEEIIADAVSCYRAGASILHLHARDKKGKPTYKRSVFEEMIPEIRKKCSDVIVCVTTSGRVYKTLYCRSDVLNLEGDCKPDMASLTLGSMNFPKTASINSPRMIQKLAHMMLEKGIKPELEIFEVGMINYGEYLRRKGFLADDPPYYNLFLGSLGTIPAQMTDLEHLVESLPSNAIWAATGVGKFQLPVNVAAIVRGGHVRVGLEDNIYFDESRTQLATNHQLIQRLVSFSRDIGRDIATPKETRNLLKLN